MNEINIKHKHGFKRDNSVGGVEKEQLSSFQNFK